MYAQRNSTDSQAHTHLHTRVVNSVSDKTNAVDVVPSERKEKNLEERN